MEKFNQYKNAQLMTEGKPKSSRGKITNVKMGFNIPQKFRKKSQIMINYSTSEQKARKESAAEIDSDYSHEKLPYHKKYVMLK